MAINRKVITNGALFTGVLGPESAGGIEGLFRVHTMISNIGCEIYQHVDDGHVQAHRHYVSPVCLLLYDDGHALQGHAQSGTAFQTIDIHNFVIRAGEQMPSITVTLENAYIILHQQIPQMAMSSFNPMQIANLLREDTEDKNASDLIAYARSLVNAGSNFTAPQIGSMDHSTKYQLLFVRFSSYTFKSNQIDAKGSSQGNYVYNYKIFKE